MYNINITIHYINGTTDNLWVKTFTYLDGKIYFFESCDNTFWVEPCEIDKIEIL